MWLTLALALAPGCRSFDEEPTPPDVELPDAWVSPTTSEGASWSFGDATLERLIAEALENNRELASAAARLEAALVQARIAGADRLPTLDANLNGSRVRQNFVGLPIPGAPDPLVQRYNSFGVSLDLSWEVDLWGRVRAGELAAEADARASTADLFAARQSIAAQTAKAWFALVEARQQAQLARDTVASFEDNAEWIRERYQRGVAQPLDLRLALSNAADARAALQGTEVVAGRTARQLEVLLGRYPAGDAEVSSQLPGLEHPIPAGLPAELLERRPDLRAARERLIASDRRLDQAGAARLPSLRLTASGGRASDDLGDLLDGDFDVWAVAGGLTAPLFHGGRLKAGEELADARTREAYAQWTQRALIAFSEVETALGSEAYLERRVRELREATDQARAAERLARDRYRAGVEGVLAVLEAQRRAVSNEARWLAARRERLDNRIDLWLALGGEPVEGDDS
jgi:NodT family efflux transporter outer membrane factor (OMF) lipoprotein